MLSILSAMDPRYGTDRTALSLEPPAFNLHSVSLTSAVDVIRTVAANDGRLDAIVISFEHLTDNNEAIAVARAIRGLDSRLSFRGVIRVNATPIVFYTRQSGLAFSADPALPRLLQEISWSAEADGFIAGSVDLPETIIALAKRWREALLQELDYVGYTVSIDQVGRVRVGHALQRKRRESELLSDEATPGALRKAQYLILAEDFFETFATYDELKYLIENYEAIASNERVKPETIFQHFFERNPRLIHRDIFDYEWAKPKLRLPDKPGNFYQPDFVLRPRVGLDRGANWEILDLKLPGDPLVTKRKFHPSTTQKVTAAIRQLRDYREYFNRPDARPELIERFGRQPVNPRISILIGRSDRAAQLDHAQGGDLDVNIITYDEVVEFEESRLMLQGHFAGILP